MPPPHNALLRHGAPCELGRDVRGEGLRQVEEAILDEPPPPLERIRRRAERRLEQPPWAAADAGARDALDARAWCRHAPVPQVLSRAVDQRATNALARGESHQGLLALGGERRQIRGDDCPQLRRRAHLHEHRSGAWRVQCKAERHLGERKTAVCACDGVELQDAPQQRGKVDRRTVRLDLARQPVRHAQQQPRGGDALLREPALAQARLQQRADAAHGAHRQQRARLLLQQIMRHLQHLRARRQRDHPAVDRVYGGTPCAKLAGGLQRVQEVDQRGVTERRRRLRWRV
eukprot:scaffold96868_cov79-Phaeocystis_antarctica.AAC.6